MTQSNVSLADVLFGHGMPTEPSLRSKIIGVIALQRPALAVMIFPVVLRAMALAGGGIHDPRLPFLLLVTWLVASASFIIHDIVDIERDKRKWPLRPLPSGVISKSAATLQATLMATVGLVIALLVFNRLFAALTLMVLGLTLVYVLYTRDKIGYLTSMWIPGFILVAVWTAFSPETVFSPLPWFTFAFAAATNAAIQITGESFDPLIKAFIVRPKPSTEGTLYVGAIIAMFIVGTIVFFYAHLPWPYMVVLPAIILLALTPAKHLRERQSPEKLKNTFKTITMCNLLYWLTVAVLVWI
jgi:4-hydroxybenzoate polyprenyltransferase